MTTDDAPVPSAPATPTASSPQRARRRVDPGVLTVLGVVLGALVATLHHPQPGMFVVAGSLALAAVLRLLARPRASGSLVVRSRHIDVFVLALLAVVIAVLAAVTPFPARG